LTSPETNANRRTDDFDKAWDELDKDPVNQRWQESMGRLFEPVLDQQNG